MNWVETSRGFINLDHVTRVVIIPGAVYLHGLKDGTIELMNETDMKIVAARLRRLSEGRS